MRKGLRQETFKYVEGILNTYNRYEPWIKQRKEAVAHPYKIVDENIGGGKANRTSDPTGDTASRLAIDKQLQNLQAEYTAVKETLRESRPVTRDIIQLYYFDRPRTKTWDGIAVEVNYSKKTCLNLRDQFVCDVADKLGLV